LQNEKRLKRLAEQKLKEKEFEISDMQSRYEDIISRI
jgi:hypothetical protein